jgi:hypothetical protein
VSLVVTAIARRSPVQRAVVLLSGLTSHLLALMNSGQHVRVSAAADISRYLRGIV